MGCIYCGTAENMTVSDIIPDALTVRKLTNRNVCKIHNNTFSDMFESEVINEFAPITNILNVRSSKRKAKTYASYSGSIYVDGEEYPTKFNSSNKVIPTHIQKSVDGKKYIGPMEELKKMKGVDESKIVLVDPTQEEVTISFKMNLSMFTDKAMCRLATKIAYEWYCLLNNIDTCESEFGDIVDYIVTGNGTNPTELLADEEVYRFLENKIGYGSHMLVCYQGKDGGIYVLVDLFGVAAYKVKLLDKATTGIDVNMAFHLINLTPAVVSFQYNTIEELGTNYKQAFQQIQCGGMKIAVPKDMNDNTLEYEGLLTFRNGWIVL